MNRILFSCSGWLNSNKIFLKQENPSADSLPDQENTKFNSGLSAPLSDGVRDENRSIRDDKNVKTRNKNSTWFRRRSTKQDSNNRDAFTVLTPVSYSHLEEDDSSQKHEESPGREALIEGLKAYDSKNYELARYYYENAALSGELLALYNLGIMLVYGQGVPKDQRRACECFIVCSSYGMTESMAQLGYMYMHGKGVDKDYVKARHWFKRSNETREFSFSQYYLAEIYLHGRGVPVDSQAGLSWLVKSAYNGYPPAIFNLAVIHASGKSNKELAVPLYKLAALYMEDAESQNNLGVLFATGDCGVNKSNKEAIRYFRMAASYGISEAFFNLGEAYSQGKTGLRKNIYKSAHCYYRAAQLGENSQAEFNLGNIFFYGDNDGILPNLPVSLYWFESAAKKGHSAARNNALELRRINQRLRILKQSDLDKYKHHSKHIYC